MHNLFSGKLIRIVLVVLTFALSLTWLACTPQPKPAEVLLPPKASILVMPSVVKTTDTSMTIYCAGFEPNKTVTVAIVGTFKGFPNPALGSAVANQSGAVKISAAASGIWGTGGDALQVPPGLYTLEASQKGNNIVASAPFVLEK